MSTPEVDPPKSGAVTRAREAAAAVQDRAHHTLLWNVWERMLETEFVDRSVALAGKAFVSFFPLVIVVAAFLPSGMRASIFTSLLTRFGVQGEALALAREAFKTSDDVRRATGILGLLFTFFFASSFTTALQRVYLRAWRRPRNLKVGSYTRGLVWLVALLAFMTANGAIARRLDGVVGIGLFVVIGIAMSVAWWWFTAWYLLLGHVRWRVLLPSALISSVLMFGYGATASLWMPGVIERHQNQFGFFGIALALVTWFSGAAICLIVSACAGPVFAEDPGRVGQLVRGRDRDDVLTPGAPPSLPAPVRSVTLRDAFASSESADD